VAKIEPVSFARIAEQAPIAGPAQVREIPELAA
jgi:hypothetical protein